VHPINTSSMHELSDTVFASELAMLLSCMSVWPVACKLPGVQRRVKTIMPMEVPKNCSVVRCAMRYSTIC